MTDTYIHVTRGRALSFLSIPRDRTDSHSESLNSQLRTVFKAAQELFGHRSFVHIISTYMSDANATLTVMGYDPHQPTNNESATNEHVQNMRGLRGHTVPRISRDRIASRACRTGAVMRALTIRTRRNGSRPPLMPHTATRQLRAAGRAQKRALSLSTWPADIARVDVDASAAPARGQRAAWV